MEIWFLMDASGSVYKKHKNEPQHYLIQMSGHIEALADQEVRRALKDWRAVVHVAVWAGPGTPYKITPKEGVYIYRESDVDVVSEAIRTGIPLEALQDRQTYHVAPLEFVARFKRHQYAKLVIDLATDEGLSPRFTRRMSQIRNRLIAANGEINVFAVALRNNPVAFKSLEDNVRTGFILHGDYGADYGKGLKRKMLLELQAT